MTIPENDDDALDRRLGAPWLHVPDDFVQRVLSALPARPATGAPGNAKRPALVWLQAAAAALCCALGAVEVLWFVGGLWVRSAVAFG